MPRIEKKIMRRRLANAYLSSVISISLVLFLLGFSALVFLNARAVSDYFKEKLSLSLILSPSTDEKSAIRKVESLSKLDFVKQANLVTKEQGRRELIEQYGEDFLRIIDDNSLDVLPLSISLSLKADYVSVDSLAKLEKRFDKDPMISEFIFTVSLVEALNSNISKISLIVMALICLLLFISFVLINNTMRLLIYSNRFTIHTMRLVGASSFFIKKPFLLKSTILSIISSILASALLALCLYFLNQEFTNLFALLSVDKLLMVITFIFVSGLFICLLSTLLAVSKISALNRDEIYA